jgi:uncharacterized protein YwgA
MGKVTNSKDLLMLLLAAKGAHGEDFEAISGRTRIVKMVFLFDKEIRRTFQLDSIVPDDALPEFQAYHFGPFSSDVYTDLEFLVEMEFVSAIETGGEPAGPEEAEEYDYWQTVDEDTEDGSQGYPETVFSLTDIGREFVKEDQAGELSDAQWDALSRFKARCTSIPLRALLRYVYTKYPEYTSKSKIRGKVLR